MALWGLRWHRDGRPDLWWEPSPQVKLWAFATSEHGAFVVVESVNKPHPDADLLSATQAPEQLSQTVSEKP